MTKFSLVKYLSYINNHNSLSHYINRTMRIKFGTQGYKYFDIMSKLVHFIQKAADP